MERRQAYQIGGLTVRSAFQFSHLTPSADRCAKDADVEISFVEAVSKPRKRLFESDWITVGDRHFVFRPRRGLEIAVQDGRQIFICRSPDVSNSELNLYVIGSAWGVICHQRGMLPLHCSAVALGEAAVSFGGAPGAGKSTMAAALAAARFDHFCDDMAIVDVSGDRCRMAPMPKGVKLFNEAARIVGATRLSVANTGDARGKFYVQPQRVSSAQELIFGSHYILEYHDRDECSIMPIDGAAKFQHLYSSVFRSEWVRWLRPLPDLFDQLRTLADTIEVYCFKRKHSLNFLTDGADELAEHILRSTGGQK